MERQREREGGGRDRERRDCAHVHGILSEKQAGHAAPAGGVMKKTGLREKLPK